MVTTPSEGSETKDRILAAGVAEFAAKGFAGARVDRIARQAQSNKRLIYHYFGSKEGLYEAVVTAVTASISAGDDSQPHVASPRAPTVGRLLLWAGLEGKAHAIAALVESRAREIAEAQQRGVIRRDADAEALAVLELGVFVASVIRPRSGSGPADLLTRLARPSGRKPRIRLKPDR